MKPKHLINGKLVTPGLFIETCGENMDLAVYTLQPADKIYQGNGKKYISMHKLFVQYDDPTGYEFAIKELGSWEHFQKMLAHKELGDHFRKWMEEIKARLDSKAIESIRRIAKDGGSQTELSAAKWLAAREYEEKGEVGRPSKKRTKAKERKEAEEVSLSTKKELERLGLH